MERSMYLPASPATGRTPATVVSRHDRLAPRDLDSWNPLHCLVCVIDEPIAAQQAVAALRAAGFADADLRLAEAREFMALYDAQRAMSPLARLVAHARALGDEGMITEKYLDEARGGHPTVIVYAPGDERTRRAQGIVARYRAHTIHYYGRWAIRGLADTRM